MKKILAMGLVLMLCLSFQGCGGGQGAEKAVTDLLDTLKALEYDTAGTYFAEGSEMDNKNLEALDFMAEPPCNHISYEIVSTEKVSGSEATVTVSIRTLDMKPVVETFAKNTSTFAMSGEASTMTETQFAQKMEEMFLEAVSNSNGTFVTKETTVSVVKVDGEWKVKGTQDFFNAMLGGLYEALGNLSNATLAQ